MQVQNRLKEDIEIGFLFSYIKRLMFKF